MKKANVINFLKFSFTAFFVVLFFTSCNNPDTEQLTETARVPWTKKERVKPALIIIYDAVL